jgi:hypothetical protein
LAFLAFFASRLSLSDLPTFFAEIPGSAAGYRVLTRVLPLDRGVLVEREGTVFVR